ncbi:MAG: fatty acid--CoA ligase family protein [Myxococcales bacterium]|nr:fatty acid--CoA ligase family protein [Myxococcales bacterium]
MKITADDHNPLVLRGECVVTRSEIYHQAMEQADRYTREHISRVMVCSDDPVKLLSTIKGCVTAGIDLWVAHTSLSSSVRTEIATHHGIELMIGDEEKRIESDQTIDRANPVGRIHTMTSGTSGKPKIAEHSLSSLLSRIMPTKMTRSHHGGMWLLTYQATGFAGLQVILTATLSGGQIVVPEQRTPIGFYKAATAHSVTQISGTPTFWRAFLMVVEPETLKLRQVTLGGEVVDQGTLDRLREAFPSARITHIYASTEAGVVFTVHDGQEGFPISFLQEDVPGVKLRVRDGRLQVKSPSAMRAYATIKRQPFTEDGWLDTQDRCEVRGERGFILGREDAVINVAGSKVYPLEIERFLLQLPSIREARAYGVPNPIAGMIVGADVVLDPQIVPAPTKRDIITTCQQNLASYQVPRLLTVVDSIDIQASGKKG